MYNSIYELPSQVRASLDEHDLGVFLETYNSLNPSTKEEVKSAMTKAWEACKELPSSFSFCITASVDVIDRQKEIIDINSIINHMDSFIDYGGNIQDEHGDYHIATIWKWEPTEIVVDGRNCPAVNVWGNVFGGDKVYDKARQDFVNGKNNLSIAGEADLGSYQCDERGCYVKRNVEQLMEISLCAVPCNPMATLVWYNQDAKLTKSMDNQLKLSVEKYEIHRDAQFCPIMAVKRSLQKVGMEAHAKTYGVEVPLSEESRVAKSHSLGYVKKDGKIIVQSKERMLRKAYGNCLQKGYITEMGEVKNKMPLSVFEALQRQRFIRKHNGRFVFRTAPMSKSASNGVNVAKEDFLKEINKMSVFGKSPSSDESSLDLTDEVSECVDTDNGMGETTDYEIQWDYLTETDIFFNIVAHYVVDTTDGADNTIYSASYDITVGDDTKAFKSLDSDATQWIEERIKSCYGSSVGESWRFD